MLKNRIIAVVAGLAMLVGVAGSTGIIADAFGLPVTSQADACNSTSTSGGGC